MFFGFVNKKQTVLVSSKPAQEPKDKMVIYIKQKGYGKNVSAIFMLITKEYSTSKKRTLKDM